MTELRLHRSLYAEPALADAIRLYAAHAEITREAEGEHHVLRIESARPGRGARVARELANYALGLTIQARGAGSR